MPLQMNASTPVDGGLRPLRDPGAGGLDEDDEEWRQPTGSVGRPVQPYIATR